MHHKQAAYRQSKEEWQMSTESSDLMMDLLKELAMLKELDRNDKPEPASEVTESELRKQRRREIADRIKALGEPAT
jgi:hypothetical protein